MPNEITDKASFDFIRYASVWEDADILCQALASPAEGGRILSVASAGDNVLALLTLNPKDILACDVSSVQLSALELRIAAFKMLTYPQVLEFLGVLPNERRWMTYDRLRGNLSGRAQAFWDAMPEVIDKGIIHGGKFERYLRLFGQYILAFIHSKRKRKALIENKTIQEQRDFYSREWDTTLWRLLFKVFFSRFLMGKLGRDPAFFDQVEGDVGARILTRSKHALTEIKTFTNPYLTYIMTGNYKQHALPAYLREENFEMIQSRLDRVSLYHGSIPPSDRGSFDAFNLSDIFEYMTDEEFEGCYGQLLKVANPEARLAYWNMLAPRSCPEAFEGRARLLGDLSSTLHQQDKAWFYSKFYVDQVK